ncbi:hypothetical protein [Thermodesulforhabdus norvegica]|uniref:Uncharacterized protein n=1 Tax=Thermodesulforhabdus norvegica TaxID=39841 RepID=A0A1I4UHE7_9BACT|nr:hypothetical protein [Thermodesulforhabdus norvegica]SFM88398.1 hypothetical protein SAMN05660836_01800 [Thermodesulforhabdus norvegica]
MAIPTENNYIEWVLLNIKEYFRRLGYRVLTYSIGHVKERLCPVDRVLVVGNKIVGLQFKRPLTEASHPRFNITLHQQEMIGQARWIFYCLPDFTDLRLQEVALYHCRFVPAEEIKNGEVERYFRWGPFAQGLVECWIGLEITEMRVEDLFRQIAENPMEVYISLNKKAEEVFLLSRIFRPPLELEREPA